jgi:hypothetical protein
MLRSGLIEFGSHTFGAHEYRDNMPALLLQIIIKGTNSKVSPFVTMY